MWRGARVTGDEHPDLSPRPEHAIFRCPAQSEAGRRGRRWSGETATTLAEPVGEVALPCRRNRVIRIFAALAEFERELIRERTVAGLKAAQADATACCAIPPQVAHRRFDCAYNRLRATLEVSCHAAYTKKTCGRSRGRCASTRTA